MTTADTKKQRAVKSFIHYKDWAWLGMISFLEVQVKLCITILTIWLIGIENITTQMYHPQNMPLSGYAKTILTSLEKGNCMLRRQTHVGFRMAPIIMGEIFARFQGCNLM